MYIGGYNSSVFTYDTVQETLGAIPVPGQTDFQEEIAVDGLGDLYSIESTPNNGIAEEVKPDGTFTNTTLNPAVGQPNTITIDADGNVFVGGYTINELTTGGVQTQVNTKGASDGPAVDAANILYATRYSPTNGVAELAPTDYATPLGKLDYGSPLGLGIGSDGTLAVGNYNVVDIIDRTHGSLDLGNQSIGVTGAGQSMQILNIGNKPLTISEVSLTGDGYDLAAGTNDCASGTILAPAEICSVSVTLTALHGGTAPGTLTIVSNSLYETTTQTTTLKAEVDAAYLTASPSPLAFPTQAKGTSSGPVTVTLTNAGLSYNAGVGTPTSSDPTFKPTLGSSCLVNVAVGSTCQMTVTFTPTAIAHYSATISIPVISVNANLPSTTTFTVTGDGVAPPVPVATFSPATLSFANQIQGTGSTPLTTTLKNTGNGPLTIHSFTIGGANLDSFTQTNNCSSPLAVNASCSIFVTFTPTNATPLTASLILSDDTATGSDTVALSGTGIEQPAPKISLTPAELDFGSQTQNTASSAQIATLKNTGNAPLQVTSISLVGAGAGSYAKTTNCGSSVAAGASCTISVTFTPTSTGAQPASLQVLDNDTPENVTLTGTGTAVPAPIAIFTPTAVAFGSVPENTASAPQTVTLKNTGNAVLTLTGFQISGSGNFSQSNNCGGSLAAGASCSLSILFTPQALGAQTATLTVGSNTSGTSPSVALTGTGGSPLAPAVSLTPTSLAFGNQTQGTSSAAQAITVKNTGTAALNSIVITLEEGSQDELRRLTRIRPAVVTSTSDYSASALGAMASLSGSGGGFALPHSSITYTVTATSGSDMHSTTVQLTVK